MFNGIHEKGMSKNHRVKVNSFPGGTSATILENIDQLVKSKPDCLIVPHMESFRELYRLKVYPAGNGMFKVNNRNNRNTRTRCEICSKLTIKTPERR